MLTLCCSAILNCSDENVTIPRLPKREAAARPRATHKPFTVFFAPCRGKKQIEPWKPEGNGERNRIKMWVASRWGPLRRRQVAAGLSRDFVTRGKHQQQLPCSPWPFKARCSCSHPSRGDLVLVTTLIKQIFPLHIETSAQFPSNYSP